MYFWNIHALAEELMRGSLTEKQKMLYLICYLCIVFFHSLSGQFPGTALKIFGFFFFAAFQAVTATVCFQANGRGDGRNFLERYVCLQVPLTIRFWVICIPASFLVGVVVFFINMPESVLLAVMLFIGLGILWAYIALLRSYIAKVAAPPVDGDLTAGPPASA